MPTRFTLPHIDITQLRGTDDYQGQGGGGSSAIRIREEHGARLLNELNAALVAIDQVKVVDPRLPPVEGGYLEVELRRGTSPDVLQRKRDGIKPGASKEEENSRVVGLFVPDHARAALLSILEDYRTGELTEVGQNPPHKANVEPIEAFRRARLETLWTDDPSALPTNPQHQMWWAVWIERGREQDLEDICQRLQLRAANKDRRLYFPEMAVVPVLATRAAIELMMFATSVIMELRRATDNPVFFTDDVRDTQHEWSDDLASRVQWPGTDAPAVCLLDTGVNRGHALIEPALAVTDLHAVNTDWGTDDHDDHGTSMAGLALHGDLTAKLGDVEERELSHRIESVKLLPPQGHDPNDPNDYGAITQAAVALPQIAAPDRQRIYCMAVTNDSVSGARPSTWSSAIDQAAAGTMPGDDDDAPHRLFVISAGNTEPVLQMTAWHGQDAYPAEDPCQAWNALTIGGYTDLNEVTDPGYEDWSGMAEIGALSPHSRTSVGWLPGRAPFKPELVLEAGNRAVSPSGNDILNVDSLGLLTTGRDVGARPLVAFAATSAATAQAARMATQIAAAHPEYWPEMIRALMVHSGEYTAPMQQEINSRPQLRDRYAVVRRFGYGVPDYDRAVASARDHLAIIAQSEIQPFNKKGRRFNECHYYPLPMPNSVLEQLDNEQVELKITLSYFVDPNPGLSANIDPQRYQSFGLRFDLKRRGETLANFKRRVNAAEREGSPAPRHPDDSHWLLGPDSISCGSLHCDKWVGPAVDLLGRDHLCIKPVGGWWRDRASADVVNRSGRYALVVTLKAPRTDVDLYTVVQSILVPPAEIETPV